jgi:hypothetical protein
MEPVSIVTLILSAASAALKEVSLQSIKNAYAPLPTKLVAIPPERVDEPYDSSAFVPGEHYVRLWLAEVQHRAKSYGQEGGYLFFSKAEFRYGDKQVAIPAFLGPSGFGMAGVSGGSRVTGR